MRKYQWVWQWIKGLVALTVSCTVCGVSVQFISIATPGSSESAIQKYTAFDFDFGALEERDTERVQRVLNEQIALQAKMERAKW